MRRKRASRYAKIASYKESRPCMDCGQYFPAVCMDFDHRDPKQKRFSISNDIARLWEKTLEEIAKCDLVCANCHRIRTHNRKQIDS